MGERRIVYPDYTFKVVEGGDVALRFSVRGSKFGAVEVIFTLDEAEGLANAIDKACFKSLEMLEAERASGERRAE